VGFGEIGGHPRKGPKSVRLAYALAYDRPDIRFVCFTRLRERPWHGKRHELAELTQGPRRTVVNLFAWSDQIENGADVNGESSTTTRRRNLGQTARRKRRKPRRSPVDMPLKRSAKPKPWRRGVSRRRLGFHRPEVSAVGTTVPSTGTGDRRY
jgi:hypothetical protein